MITGRDLVEKLYSNSEENYTELDYLLERAFSEGYEYAQREFGFIQDVKRSGLSRTLKRNIGRFRNKVADKIDDSIMKSYDKHANDVQKYLSSDRYVNGDIERKLLREAKEKHNVRTLGLDIDGLRGNYTFKSKNVLSRFNNNSDEVAERIVNPFLYEGKSGERIKKKVSNALKSNEDLIIHPSKSGTEYLGHEIGHIENSKTSNPIKKFINKIANDPKTREDINTSAILRLKDEGLGFKEAGKRFVKGNLVLAEEKMLVKIL